MSKLNKNQENTNMQEGSGNPNPTETWERCECNLPEISSICKCTPDSEVNENERQTIKPDMVGKNENVSVDENKRDDPSTPGEDKSVSTDIGSPSKPGEGEGNTRRLQISPDIDSSSKPVENECSNAANTQCAVHESSNIEITEGTDIPGSDFPPDEGKTRELKEKGFDISKIICNCKKDAKDERSPTGENPSTSTANCERTFIMVKPDGVHRGLVGKIIKKLEQKGFRLVALTLIWPSEELLREHYKALTDQAFFSGLIKYMSSGPVVPMVWEGMGIVSTGRNLLGATNPADSAPGTIRGDLCIQVGRNICHASDSVDSANNEIDLWFTEKDLISWVPAIQPWVYED